MSTSSNESTPTTPLQTKGASQEVKSPSTAPTTEKMSEKTHAAVDKISESLEKTEVEVRAKVAEADAKVRELGTQAQTSAQDSMANVSQYVKSNPLASAGIAFATGFLLSALIRK